MKPVLDRTGFASKPDLLSRAIVFPSHSYQPRPLASRQVEAVTRIQTLQTSQNLQTNLLGGGFTLPLPPPYRLGLLSFSFSWRALAALDPSKSNGKTNEISTFSILGLAPIYTQILQNFPRFS